MFFDAAHDVSTLLRRTLLSLILIVAVIPHASVEIVDGDGAVDTAGVIVEGHCAVHPAGFACTVVLTSTTAGPAATASSASSTTTAVCAPASAVGILRSSVCVDVVLSAVVGGIKGCSVASWVVALLGRTVPGVMGTIAVFALFSLAAVVLVFLELFDLSDQGGSGRLWPLPLEPSPSLRLSATILILS